MGSLWRRLRRQVAPWSALAVLACTLPLAGNPGEPPPLYPRPEPVNGPEAAWVPPSEWYAGQAERYRDALPREAHDLLVVPFQIQGFGIDAAGRSLMTALLVERLRETGLSVPDPELMAFSLGEHRRRFGDTSEGREELRALAARVGAPRILSGYVGHLRDGTLRITLHVDECARPLSEPPRSVWDRAGIPFSATELPSSRLAESLDEIVAAIIGRPAPATRPALASLPERLAIPADLEAWLAGNADPGVAALHLQFLGAITPGERVRQRLFERSLLALARVAPEAPNRRVLEARAWAELGRRPKALAVLGDDSTPAARSLRAYLDGDLPDAGNAIAAITSPLLRFLAGLDQYALQSAYDSDASPQTRHNLLRQVGPDFAPLLAVQLGDPAGSAALLTQALEQHFPVPGHGLSEALSLEVVAGSASRPARIELAPRLHLDALLAHSRGEVLRRTSAQQPSRGDHLQALLGAADHGVFESLRFTLARGEAQQALAEIEALAPVYGDHPLLERRRAHALGQLARTEPSRALRRSLARRAEQADRRASVWSGGQTEAGGAGSPESALYDADFPRRDDAEMLEHTIHGVWALDQLHARLEAAGEHERARQLALANAHRFRGDPERPDFLRRADPRESTRDPLLDGSGEWDDYLRLANQHLWQGRIADADRVFHAYLDRARPPAVPDYELAVRAWLAGSEMFWRGESERAKPLFELAAQRGGNSSTGHAARYRLHLMAGRYGDALIAARLRAETSRSSYVLRDLLMTLHLVGASDAAWSVFDQVRQSDPGPHVWTAALVGHRMAGLDADALADWLGDEHRELLDLPVRDDLQRHLLRLLQGRAPDLDGPALVTRFHAAATRARLARELPPDFTLPEEELDARVADSAFFAARHAGGYQAWQRGDYEGALARFSERSSHAPSPAAGASAECAGILPSFQPYFLWSALAADESELGERCATEWLAAIRGPSGPEPERLRTFLASSFAAIRAGLGGDLPTALAALRQAFNVRLYTDQRSFHPWHQLVELSEALHRASGEPAYRELALDWARRHQRVQPMFGWAWALEARYLAPGPERSHTLGMALRLDRHSIWLDGIPESERRAALRQLEAETIAMPSERRTASSDERRLSL
jgi:hypothetical protein